MIAPLRLEWNPLRKSDIDIIQWCCMFFNKSWKQFSTKQLLYGHLPLISHTIHVRQVWCAGHCWSSKEQTHKWHCPLDAFTWTHQCWLSRRNFHSAALCGHLILSRRLVMSNGQMMRGSQKAHLDEDSNRQYFS